MFWPATDAEPGTADKKEFLKITQAIALGFLTMGTVGYVVKLSMRPLPSPLSPVWRAVADAPVRSPKSTSPSTTS